MPLTYSARAVVFNPQLLEKNDKNSDQFTAFSQAHVELFFGSARVKRKRIQKIFEAIETNPLAINISSDMLYVVLANNEIDIDIPANQLVLLNLIEKNNDVREFFLQDIFGNESEDKYRVIQSSADTYHSFEKLSPELIQAKVGLEEYQNYHRDPKAWLNSNKQRVEEILQEIASLEVCIISDKAKAAFVSKLSQSIGFAYSFFSRWNVQVIPNVSALRKFARINPGAALGILMNPILATHLKGALTTEDKKVILQNAAEQTTENHQKHYFRETLVKLLPLATHVEIDVAECIKKCSSSLEVLRDLIHYASVSETDEQKNLQDMLDKQAAYILVKVSNKKNSSEMAQLIKPYVVRLIENYHLQKRPYQAEQLQILFNDFPDLVENLYLDNSVLSKLSPDENFLRQNNPLREDHPRVMHPIKSFLNRWFGWFPETFAKLPNNLNLATSIVAISADEEETAVSKELKIEAEIDLTTGPVQSPIVSDTTEENKSFRGMSRLFRRDVHATLESTETRLEPYFEEIVASALTIEQEIDLTTGPAQHAVISDTDLDALPRKKMAVLFTPEKKMERIKNSPNKTLSPALRGKYKDITQLTETSPFKNGSRSLIWEAQSEEPNAKKTLNFDGTDGTNIVSLKSVKH